RAALWHATALHRGRCDMSEACTGGAIRRESGSTAATGAADWLYLAAAPTFAIMALLTAVLDGKRVTADRNGPDVLADERLSPAALAEADLRLARSRPSVLTRPRRNFDKIPPR